MLPDWKENIVEVSVSYFDSVNGGAGLVAVQLIDLAAWLDSHPGFLIRKIQMPLAYQLARGI